MSKKRRMGKRTSHRRSSVVRKNSKRRRSKRVSRKSYRKKRGHGKIRHRPTRHRTMRGGTNKNCPYNHDPPHKLEMDVIDISNRLIPCSYISQGSDDKCEREKSETEDGWTSFIYKCTLCKKIWHESCLEQQRKLWEASRAEFDTERARQEAAEEGGAAAAERKAVAESQMTDAEFIAHRQKMFGVRQASAPDENIEAAAAMARLARRAEQWDPILGAKMRPDLAAGRAATDAMTMSAEPRTFVDRDAQNALVRKLREKQIQLDAAPHREWALARALARAKERADKETGQ